MIKMNSLKFGDKRVIGQLYIDGKPTNEVLVVQYGRALSLNGDRSWPDVSAADNKFTLEPRQITIHNVASLLTKDIFLA
jgi:hypothetical protein